MNDFRNNLMNNFTDSLDLFLFLESLLTNYSTKQAIDGHSLLEILNQFGVDYSPDKCQAIAEHFLHNDAGFSEFINLVRGNLTNRKQNMLIKFWNRLDFGGKGFTYYNYIITSFKAQRHPGIGLKNKKNQTITFNYVNTKFIQRLQSFERMKPILNKIRGNEQANSRSARQGEIGNSMITEEEFEEFFWMFSFENDNDYHFEKMFNGLFGFS